MCTQGRWLFLFVVLLNGPVAAQSPAPVERAISAYILPNVERFARTSVTLAKDVEALCAAGSPNALFVVRDTFRITVLDFARVEFLRIGPMEVDNRRDRLLFWPDHGSAGLQQVQQELAEEDASILDPRSLAKKSVALQGFGTLDYLLFGSGSETLPRNAGSFRCLFAQSVAANIAVIAGEVLTDWQDDSGFAAVWTMPAPENDLYRSEEEAIAALVGIAANALEAIRDQQLKPIAPDGGKTKSYQSALLWRSNMTRDMMAEALAGLHNLVTLSGLLKALPQERRWIENTVAFQFDNAQRALGVLNGPVQAYVEDPQRSSQLSYLIFVTDSLHSLLGEQVAEALGLSATFPPPDGG